MQEEHSHVLQARDMEIAELRAKLDAATRPAPPMSPP
jgi:hypothetical protein